MAQTRKKHPKAPPRNPGREARQKTRGRIIWALLFAIFGFTIGVVSTEDNYFVPALALVAGAVAGYFVGRAIDRDTAR
ncbi:MAG TPA: hypothetical protein VFZ78_11255 [Flavisolibacter sp.]